MGYFLISFLFLDLLLQLSYKCLCYVVCKSFLVAQQLHSYKFWFDSTSIFFIYCSNFLLTKQVPVAEWLAQQTEVAKVASSNP